jgi:8-oxo-dGTP pyrophosphatase MutT (NUDIX family)
MNLFIYHKNKKIILSSEDTYVGCTDTQITLTWDQYALNPNPDNYTQDIIIIYHQDPAELKGLFFQMYTIIEAAGGLVIDPEGRLLFIFRRGKWDLPKGKMELGETPEITAVREVSEEAGIYGLQIVNRITETYHIYDESDKQILKISHWFLMRSDHIQSPIPQSEEDITEAVWFRKEDLKIPLDNTFHNIIDVISSYENQL